MSLVSSRRTYDTDSITLRRIFAYDLSNSPFSTGFVLTAISKGVVTFTSANLSLSTIGVPNLPAQLSTLEGQLLSTSEVFFPSLPSSANIFLPSTVAGLGNSGYVSTSYITSTILGLGTFGYLSSSVFGDVVTSTIEGLATYGYVSSTQLFSSLTGLGSLGYLSSSQYISGLTTGLTSTVEGLGSAGYLSTLSLYSTLDSAFPSTVANLGSLGYISSANFFSSISSLGTLGYVSTASLTSTVGGLGSIGYISSASLTSSIQSLGSFGFISSLQSTIRSSFSNQLAGNWCNAGFLYSNLTPNSTIQTFQFDIGNRIRSQMQVSTTNLDIEIKANLQYGYYDSRSIQYDFSTLLCKGVSLNTSSIIAQENIAFYILNANAVNLPFFFIEKFRFLIRDLSTISSLKSEAQYSSLSLFHRVGISTPTTNQFFAFPAKPTSVSLVLDNSTRTTP
jgi:hypothetical protein